MRGKRLGFSESSTGVHGTPFRPSTFKDHQIVQKRSSPGPRFLTTFTPLTDSLVYRGKTTKIRLKRTGLNLEKSNVFVHSEIFRSVHIVKISVGLVDWVMI